MKLETVTFSPIGEGWDWISVGFGGIALLGVFALIYQFKNKKLEDSSEISSRPIIIMVAIATLFATIAFIWSIFTNDKLENVEISAQHIRTPFGACSVDEIKAVYFFPNPEENTIPKKDDLQEEVYLIFEQKNGVSHPLSSKTYNIKEIKQAWIKLGNKM